MPSSPVFWLIVNILVTFVSGYLITIYGPRIHGWFEQRSSTSKVTRASQKVLELQSELRRITRYHNDLNEFYVYLLSTIVKVLMFFSMASMASGLSLFVQGINLLGFSGSISLVPYYFVGIFVLGLNAMAISLALAALRDVRCLRRFDEYKVAVEKAIANLTS